MKKFSEEVEETLAGYRDVAHSRGMDEALREAVEMRVYYGRECAECRGIIAKLEAECDALKARFTAPIICFCGSTRFKQAWLDMKRRFTAQGYIVLDVGFFGHADGCELTPEEKRQLDALHKRKIDLADSVYVIDIGSYVGESTKSEIAYAQAHGKPVRYLSHEFPGYQEPIDKTEAERDALKARLAEVEAEAAAMRQALTGAIRAIEFLHPMNAEEPCNVYEAWQQCKAALASSAGREVAERLEQLEAQAAKMREALTEALGVFDASNDCPCPDCAEARQIQQRIHSALSSSAGREVAERLKALEELLDLAAAFTENCIITVAECFNVANPDICYDACPRKRLRIAARKLKGDIVDAGTSC